MTGAAHCIGVAECGRNARLKNTLTRLTDPQLAPMNTHRYQLVVLQHN
jgi:hypothetical protein